MKVAPDVRDEPSVELADWAILETADGIRFLVGAEKNAPQNLRTSTPLAQFDEGTMSAVTKSGRSYHLIGEPRANPLADPMVSGMAKLYRLDLDELTVVEVGTSISQRP